MRLAFGQSGLSSGHLRPAPRLASKGPNVHIRIDRHNPLIIEADLARASDIERMIHGVIAEYGSLDILVANTGHVPYGGLFELNDDQWYESFNLLLLSMIRLARGAIPFMQARRRGDIVFIASAAVREPYEHLLLSNVLRPGVLNLAKSLSRRYARDNIRVNTITPGYFDTGRVRNRIDALVKEENLDRNNAALKVAGDIPWGCIGTSEEFAELVFFIASRKAEYITGATIQMDGGQSRGIF